MLLVIDIGNTNIVVGLVKDGKILHKARLSTDYIKTSDQYWMELKNTLDLFGFKPSQIKDVIISSVVPPVFNSCFTAAKKLTGLEPLVVGPKMDTGLNVSVDDPRQVGSDIIACAVAAKKCYELPILMIDMGTATTIFAIDKNGTLIGGSICPGVKISAAALTNSTAKLPAISLEAPENVIGKNTVNCMQSGLMFGAAAMLDGMIDRMKDELGGTATVVATGGISRFVIPNCRREIIYDHDLLLKGLVMLYENNKK